MELISHAITLLATHGWDCTGSPSFGHPALEYVCQRFFLPLEHVGIDLSLVIDEWFDLVEYGKQYINLVQQDYQTVWWKLYNRAYALLFIVKLKFTVEEAAR